MGEGGATRVGRLAIVWAVGLALGLAPAGTLGSIPTDCPRAESARWPIDRVAGADRYATAACAAQAAYPLPTVGTVLLARGDDAGGWADALAGTVLARAADGPILLTEPARLPEATAAELRRLMPRSVLVLGGPSAVGEQVVAAVVTAVPTATVERVHGPDRYATAARVSARAGASGTAFVVNGFRPADALVAGAPAARQGAALLLVGPDGVPGVTAQALQGVQRLVIVGGYGVVSEATERALAALVGAERVRRVSGGDRAETAASAARAFPSAGQVFLASDQGLVDAISAGWSAARPGGGPVLYAERVRPGRGTDRWLRLGGLGPTTPLRLVGGPAVLAADLVPTLEQRYDEAAGGGPPSQLRGLWVHLFDDSVKSRPGVDAMLDAAAAANVNSVIVEVARRQDAYYGSDVLPRTPDPALPPDLDVLGRLLTAAHDRGLAVHAWVPALPAYHGVYAGLRLPLWEAHGPGSADPWVSVSADGSSGTFFDPGVPAVQDHVVAVFRELAERYPVDAVHVDYLRYESRDWGYHSGSLQRFQEATGRSDRPAPDDAQWGAWRRQQTRDLAARISEAVHAANPTVAVTLAGSTIGAAPASVTSYSDTKTWWDVFQAWPDWLAEGLVDAVFAMNYFRQHDPVQRDWFHGWVAFEQRLDADCAASRRRSCVVAVGQGSWLNRPADSLAQLSQALQDRRGGGVLLPAERRQPPLRRAAGRPAHQPVRRPCRRPAAALARHCPPATSAPTASVAGVHAGRTARCPARACDQP